MKTLIKNALCVLDGGIKKLSIVVNGSIIEGIQENWGQETFDGTILDAQGLYLAAGFIDSHTHGAGGHDFMDGTMEAIVGACQTHLRHGTTTIVPTTLSSSPENLLESLALLTKAATYTENMPNIGGIHLEGPYFAPAQYGAQDMRYLKPPVRSEYLDILSRFPLIKRWSMAPEVEGVLEMAREISALGVVCSMGHTSGTIEDVRLGEENGFTMATHLFNAMSRLTRENAIFHLGVAEGVLLSDGIVAEVIADGNHLPPDLLRLIYKCKGADGICLVTDSMRAAGQNVSESIIGSLKDGQTVEIDGEVAYMPGRRSFGGSIATTDRLVRTMYHKVGVPLADSIKMMTEVPAKTLGLFDKKGSIALGKDADIVIFDDTITIKNIMVMGRHVRV